MCILLSEFLFALLVWFGNFFLSCELLMLLQIYIPISILDVDTSSILLSSTRSLVGKTQPTFTGSLSYLSKQEIWLHLSSI